MTRQWKYEATFTVTGTITAPANATSHALEDLARDDAYDALDVKPLGRITEAVEIQWKTGRGT